jgi:NAD(P)-dependent dehydrogenase (short-subunit alcohol dehydrogenase family)
MSTNAKMQKFALVTGAARRVGREIALHLARSGYDIGLHYSTSRKDAERTKSEIESLGRKAYLLQADVQNPVEIEALFELFSLEKRKIDLLVNSAAIMQKSDLLKITWQDWDHIFNVNLRGAWLMARYAIKFMNSEGVMINISDAGADLHWTGYGAYVISKSALNEMTRILAKELAPKIRVCGIAPGLLIKPEEMSQEEWDLLASHVPARRAGDLGALMATVDLLINNGYITGEIITLNGGASLG